ncbi:uncharacterized protein [Leptinotarsa decemlineata]|uniref:uncharacterized protein n=1 Tax=Leptinotarsa decemlineata TaxID=7539 RepID=UPI003D307102
MRYEQAHGNQGGQFDKGESGFNKGEIAAKDVKGDSGHYAGANGGKNLYEDGKMYHGAQGFNKEGKNEGQMNMMKGHKKGHKIKGFKNSHQKQETGKTEEFYDEDHDEGGNYIFNGQSGSFGENAGSSYKGGQQDGKFNTAEAKKEGHFVNELLADKANANQGRYGEAKYGGNGATYGINNGGGVNSMAGHHHSSKFFKHHPFYHHYY